jgi:hypothetical protein
MRGSARDGHSADPRALALAYEWVEAYLYDHRPAAGESPWIPSVRGRRGPLLPLFTRPSEDAPDDAPPWIR